MQRLTEKQSAGYDLIEMNGRFCDEYCHTQSVETCRDCVIDKAIQKLAEYEDLEEQGLIIKLPCKVGDKLYIIEPRFYNYEYHEGVQVGVCKRYELDEDRDWVIWVKLEEGSPHTLYCYSFKLYGKTVFLTKEEAENKLREMEAGECR